MVEVYAGGKKIDPPHQLESFPMVRSLLIEGVAHNTNGSVYVPEVMLELVFLHCLAFQNLIPYLEKFSCFN